MKIKHQSAGSTKSVSSREVRVSKTRPELEKDYEGHSVATWKSYADSRLRQFCSR